MKKFLTVLLFVALFFQALPQKGQIGIQLNPLLTIMNTDNAMNNKGYIPDEMIYDQFRLGYKAGVNYNHMFTSKWALSPSFSFNYLVYGFKQILNDNGAIASFTDDLAYGSFELSLLSKHYFKVNDNQFLVYKIGGAIASNKLWAYSSSSHLVVDSGGVASSSTNGVNDVNTTFTPRVIFGVSIVNTMQSQDKIEIGITYNHSFNPVSDYTISRSINYRKYNSWVSPVLSYFSLDIIYYLRPNTEKIEK
jgi:hypothetical protein